MEYGAHLPLIDFDGRGWSQRGLASYVDAARQLGFSLVSANDHLVFQRPWLDCIVALASVIDRSGDMGLATTVSLPASAGRPFWRRPRPHSTSSPAAGGPRSRAWLLDARLRKCPLASMSGGRAWMRRYACCGVQLKHGEPAFEGHFYSSPVALEPRPNLAHRGCERTARAFMSEVPLV
jgi:hypothetical protein